MDAFLGRAAACAALAALCLFPVPRSAFAQDVKPAERSLAPIPGTQTTPVAAPQPAEAPTSVVPGSAETDAPVVTAASTPAPKPRVVVPVGPPVPVRAPAALLRVLDKVTAETMVFEAPIGRKVRYKSLVFEVKACETRGVGEAQPQSSAYLTVTSDAAAGAALAPRQIFKGWMFANFPSLHALRHPVYDSWLVACSAAAPAQ